MEQIKELLEKFDEMMDKNQVEEAEKMLHDVLDDEETSLGTKISINNELIGYYRNFGRVEECLAQCEKQMGYIDELGDIDAQTGGTILLNLANAFAACGRLDESLEFFQKTEALYELSVDENDYLMGSLYNNISLLYIRREETDKALEYAQKALKIAEKLPERKHAEAITHQNIANIYCMMKDYKNAKPAVEKALEMFEELGEKESYAAAMANNTLGTIYAQEGDEDKALEYLGKAKDLLQKNTGESPLYKQAVQNMEYIRAQNKK